MVPGRGRDDFGLALDGPADLADPGEQGVRVFAGHTQLPGLIDQHAVVNAVELADLVLHFGGAVRAAEVLHRVDALDAVRARCVVVLMPVLMVVMAAAALAVVMMVFVVVVVMAAGTFTIVVIMIVIFDDFIMIVVNVFLYIRVLCIMVVMMP